MDKDGLVCRERSGRRPKADSSVETQFSKNCGDAVAGGLVASAVVVVIVDKVVVAGGAAIDMLGM